MCSFDFRVKKPKVHCSAFILCDFVFTAISYTVKIRTADGDDNGTESHAWVNIIGNKKKKNTGKLYLDMVGKTRFEPGSVETFSLEAADVGEVKQLEVRQLVILISTRS